MTPPMICPCCPTPSWYAQNGNRHTNIRRRVPYMWRYWRLWGQRYCCSSLVLLLFPCPSKGLLLWFLLLLSEIRWGWSSLGVVVIVFSVVSHLVLIDMDVPFLVVAVSVILSSLFSSSCLPHHLKCPTLPPACCPLPCRNFFKPCYFSPVPSLLARVYISDWDFSSWWRRYIPWHGHTTHIPFLVTLWWARCPPWLSVLYTWSHIRMYVLVNFIRAPKNPRNKGNHHY